MSKKTFAYKTVSYDSKEMIIEADVHFSREENERSRPVALFLHGGGFIVGSKNDIPPLLLEILLKSGFVVVSPNYRLCLTISVKEGPIQDCLDCYEWIRNELPVLMFDTGVEIDATQIVTVGGSCGGTLAHLMAQASQPPKAILDIAGWKYLSTPTGAPTGDLTRHSFDEAWLNLVWDDNPPPVSTAWPFTPPHGIDLSQPRFAWMVDQEQKGTLFEILFREAAISSVDPAALFSQQSHPPTCFLHGASDTLVDVEHSKRGFEELRARNIECELVLVEGEGHGFEMGVAAGTAGYEELERACRFLKDHVPN